MFPFIEHFYFHSKLIKAGLSYFDLGNLTFPFAL